MAPFALFLVLGLTAPWLGAVGTTRYVDDNTCPSVGAGTLASPYCKIQDAICNAVASDTVSVAPGTYYEAIRMKPGVSLISQAGAVDTTINAANQPCTDNLYCTKRPGTGCTVVTFGSGHTTATRLEGFTITGGAGLTQISWVAGGGIYLYSSATIVNNVITNNTLAGPRGLYYGAGVYVSLGQAVITGNTITGNRAVPAAGVTGTPSHGYGGGIWVGFNAGPIITNNVIQGNQAGDPNVAFSIGSGGGILVWPGSSTYPGAVIDRNLIADNFSDSQGGGISMLSLPNTGAVTAVTNNVIVGNRADKLGGGVYTYFNKSETINNTITGNWAFLGGGVYTGQSETALPVKITNNIIEGNHLYQFGTGGGIYSLDLSQTFSPSMLSNDLFSNDRNQSVIEQVENNLVGTNGNWSADPRFVDRGARNFHLDPNSSAIDRANQNGAPTVDYDNRPRGFDGNGVPNSPMMGDIDVGAFELGNSCLPAPELCDGLDNDCDTFIDNGFPNADGDQLADCLDPDDDNDLTNDPSDCAPFDSTSWGSPFEVTNLELAGGSSTQISWDLQNGIGNYTLYEVVSGLLSRLSATAGFGEGFCATSSVIGGSWNDTRTPPLNDGWFYLVRSGNGCGAGTLGSALADLTGSGDVCTTGVVDADVDGSPSDLDCNEGNPLISPLMAEVCDGIDNNCASGADEGNPGGGVSCGISTGECEIGTTVCSSGSLTCSGGVGPTPELCDGLDNNCNALIDDVPDTDGDQLDDCLDPDDDNDGSLDAGDCAPLNGTAFGVPVEVDDVDVNAGPSTQITWIEQSLGSGTVYEVATGQLTTSGIVNFGSGTCVGAVSSSPATDGRANPAPDTAWYYMVKSRNACGPGTYGTAGRDAQPACP